jgi:hypothetical protein
MNTKLRIGLILLALVVVFWSVAVAPSVDAATKKIADVKAQNAAIGDWMGSSVAIGEGMMVVGSPFGNTSAAILTGAAYVFGYDQATGAWDQDNKLTANDAAYFALFGWSVATNNELIAIGAPYWSATSKLPYTGSVYLFSYQAGTWVQLATLTEDAPVSGDLFGWSLAMANDLLVVGAPMVDLAGGMDAGAVYVFRVTSDGTREKLATLTAGDATAGEDQFGTSVATDGQTIVVGVPVANAAHVFSFDGSKWVEEALLTPGSEAKAYERFGAAVAVQGDTLIVGAPGADTACPGDPQCNSGAVYLFTKHGGSWLQQATFTPTDVQGGDQFGSAVALDGPVLVVGAPAPPPLGQEDSSTSSGYAYILRYDSYTGVWKPASKPRLTQGADALAGAEFGFAVALKGNRVVVGAPDPGQIGSVQEFAINRPPVAGATVNQSEVHEGDTVKVDGSASTDPDGDTLTYTWAQTAGPTVNFDPTATHFEFPAPPVPAEGATLAFRLTVNDGEEESDPPAEVSVVVTEPPKPSCQVTSHLGEKRSWSPDQDSFTFQGHKGDAVTLTLQAGGSGNSNGQRAVLILQDRIRGTWFFRADRGALPNTIQATLPATGEYLVTVMDDPFCWRSARFRGDYVLSLAGASGCLQSTQRCQAVRKKVEHPGNSCH